MYNRKYEHPSPDFTARIISKSYNIIQKQPLFLSIQNIFKEFCLPSPQYALSLVFLLSLSANILFPNSAINYDDNYDYINEIYLDGGFDNE